ncbi:MAG: MBL fold metallo-hydrolase [Calditrichaeota bacterium]|nr:MAG: MBL fold metallo-hydrolase [Calditrichota bacterium]
MHRHKNRFKNPHTREIRGWLDFLKWQLGLGPSEGPVRDGFLSPPQQVQPDFARIRNPDAARVQVTWVGHSTFLLQAAGVNILTDPIFSRRCSPVSFAGPQRLTAPGLEFAALPRIHAVLISHNHYDHLDARTVSRLGAAPVYFVPLGLARWFAKRGIRDVVELDWWETSTFADLQITCVPSQHFSGRSLFDRNRTLWSGWVVESTAGRIFFAGDTGYSPQFKEIGEKLGPFRLALIPIGAYRPRWFMRPAHVDPREAVQIHRDVRAEFSVASHWGTFPLTDEPVGEPPVLLAEALREAGIAADRFQALRPGETRVV